MKKIAVIGSTGSIGTSTLKVAAHLNEAVEVVALAGGENIELLEQQAKRFHPKIVAVYHQDKAALLQKKLAGVEVVGGMEGVCQAAAFSEADIVVLAVTGAAGLRPAIAAIQAEKTIALANKEVLVAAGEYITQLAGQYNARLIPVDSEHSAIFQCLQGQPQKTIERLILTSSGGPFRNFTDGQLEKVTVTDALRHPTWSMGKKITIDSSTLMNKGLEVIEAYWLFGVQLNKIEVVVHPQSLIHSMVEFRDRSILAQMSEPDMMLPIQYAITYPDRKPGVLPPFDFSVSRVMEFTPPDTRRFACLRLAYDAVKLGKSAPCYLNAANEILVQRFLKGEISWKQISEKLDALVQKHALRPVSSLDEILDIDSQARRESLQF